jgi:hypothetical protein
LKPPRIPYASSTRLESTGGLNPPSDPIIQQKRRHVTSSLEEVSCCAGFEGTPGLKDKEEEQRVDREEQVEDYRESFNFTSDFINGFLKCSLLRFVKEDRQPQVFSFRRVSFGREKKVFSFGFPCLSNFPSAINFFFIDALSPNPHFLGYISRSITTLLILTTTP